MNKNLFRSSPGLVVPADTVNEAGGLAYLLKPEAVLATIACTGFFGDTFYSKAEEQLDKILDAARKCDDQFVAKVAVYARRSGFMRDTPSVLCAYLFGKRALPDDVFFAVIDNMRMLSNFVRCVRSGQFGRRSLGSAGKRLVQLWLARRGCSYLWSWSSSTDPSLKDIIKLARPRPETRNRDTGFVELDRERAALYRHLVGKPVELSALPQVVQDTLAFFNDNTKPLPDVQFLKLSGQTLLPEHWRQLLERGGFEFVRRNLATAQKHGVLKDERVLQLIVDKLSSPEEVARARQFPFQMLTALSALHDDGDVPMAVKLALHKALDLSMRNVPALPGKVWIAVDTSGSMHTSVTPGSPGSPMSYLDVAALFAAALVRTNQDARVLTFANNAQHFPVNPLDTAATTAGALAKAPSGGTNCSAPLRLLVAEQREVDTFIMISDNQSWMEGDSFYTRASASLSAWNDLKRRNPKARQVRINIEPNATDQIPHQPDTLRVSGFSDAVFTAIAGWLDQKDWIAQIQEVTC